MVDAVRDLEPARRRPRTEAAAASLYQSVPFRQDAGVLMIGERTNANGSKAFREAMLAGKWDDCVEIARSQIRDGSHMLDVCIDYVGRDGTGDMRQIAGRFATASTLPLMLDSTEPQVIEAGLEMLGGRCVVNSVNYEDGDGPESRFARAMPIIREHGAAVVVMCIDEEGQARTAEWKVRVADRTIRDLRDQWGMRVEDIVVDCLTFPIGTGQEETRRDGIETIEAIRELKQRYPEVQTTLGLSNVSFGLNPAARQVLNSVFLNECVNAGLDSAIVHASKILPMSKIDDEQREVALDMVYDRRRDGYDPLQRFLQLFEGVDATSARQSRAEELAALPLSERLERRIVDGERNGLEADLDEALITRPPLEIINDTLLAGMKTVGELFGSGEMQLPFVLQSAEVMKTAVAHLEPHMDKTDSSGKGRILLATVKGDVHDIGKNLVDIILSNNGYTVVNLGIKQPISAILDAAEEHSADVIGMSGLLVKSTVIMRENLEEMNSRGVADRWPVLLGGAALTRAYVEHDLSEVYAGDVRYARDAFEGLRLMDALMAVRRGSVPTAATPDGPPDAALNAEADAAKRAERKARRERSLRIAAERRAAEQAAAGPESGPVRSDVAADNPVPTPPFWGDRVVKGIQLADYASLLDERATFMGQWGLRGVRGKGPTYEELVETEGRPRLRYWLDRFQTEGVLEAAVVYGYFPAVSKGDDLIVLREDGSSGRGAGAVLLPPAAAGPAAVPGRLLPVAGVRRDRRGRLPGRHHRAADQRVRRGAVREERLPRLPGGARAVGAAHRGAGRALARPGPGGARLRRRGPGRPGGVLQAGVPRRPLLVRLPGLPGPGGPAAGARAAAVLPDRGVAVGGVPAAPGAVDVRDRGAPPRGEVLRHMTVRLPAAVLFDLDGTLLDSEPVWDDALRQLARELGGELSAAARAATVGTNVAVSVGIVHADVGRLDADPAASGRRLVELAGGALRRRAGVAARRPRAGGRRAGGRRAGRAGHEHAAAAGAGRARAAARRALRRQRLLGRRRQRQAAPGAVPDGGRAAGRRPGGHGGGGGLADRGRVRGRGRLPGAGGAGRAPGARLGAADLRRVARRRRCRRPGRPPAPRGLTRPPAPAPILTLRTSSAACRSP